MAPRVVECLLCGMNRQVAVSMPHSHHSECPRCGYLGWAPAEALDERERRAFRERPPERRRLRIA